MPSTYTHFRFGRDVLGELDCQVRGVIIRHKDLFYIGLHGPDILFYYGALWSNEVNRVGYELHEEMADLFFDYARKRLRYMIDKEEGLAYILGFICHFALDSECHGYIEYVIKRDGITHTEIETDFERLLLQGDGLNPKKYNTASHIKVSEENAFIISSFFPNVSSYHIYRALKLMKRYNRWLLPSNHVKVLGLKGLLLVSNNYREMHGLIIQNEPNPKCEKSNKELWKRYNGAITKAAQLMEDFYHKLDSDRELNLRFHRTFGPDRAEVQKYEEGAYNV